MLHSITEWKNYQRKEQDAGMEPPFSEGEKREAQLEQIFRAHVADLYRYIYRQINNVVVAEDLTSMVFLKALRWLRQDRSSESVKGWLYATARSLIADYWREHTRMHLLPLEAAEEMPMLSDESEESHEGEEGEESNESDESKGLMRSLQARVQHLLDGLPARERDILTLRFLQGYNTAEIGQVLGISANYVRVLQLRALRRAALLEAKERTMPMETPNLPYNEQALLVLELTREEARTLNHNYLGTEHLLLGILREGSAAEELIKQGVTVERIRGGIIFILGGRPPGLANPETPGFTPRTKQVLEMAGEEAQRLGDTAISPYHLLVAILREGQGIGAQLLKVSEVRWEQVGERVQISVAQEIDEGPVTTPPDFQEALKQHPAAQIIFEKLSNAKKKRFVDHIEHAEGAVARGQEVEKAIELLQRIQQSHQPQPPQG